MIAMVTPRVQIPKAHSFVPAKKDFLETGKRAAAVSVTKLKMHKRRRIVQVNPRLFFSLTLVLLSLLCFLGYKKRIYI